MQLLVQLQLQVFLHNQDDKHQTTSDAASHPKWCSQKPEKRQMIPRKMRGGGRGRRVLRCRVQLDILFKPRISSMTVTVWHYTLQWHQGSRKLIFLLENHLRIDSTTERAGQHLQTSCSTGKRSHFCGCSFSERYNYRPAFTWNFIFVVSENNDCFLLQLNIIFSMSLLLQIRAFLWTRKIIWNALWKAVDTVSVSLKFKRNVEVCRSNILMLF